MRGMQTSCNGGAVGGKRHRGVPKEVAASQRKRGEKRGSALSYNDVVEDMIIKESQERIERALRAIRNRDRTKHPAFPRSRGDMVLTLRQRMWLSRQRSIEETVERNRVLERIFSDAKTTIPTRPPPEAHKTRSRKIPKHRRLRPRIPDPGGGGKSDVVQHASLEWHKKVSDRRRAEAASAHPGLNTSLRCAGGNRLAKFELDASRRAAASLRAMRRGARGRLMRRLLPVA